MVNFKENGNLEVITIADLADALNSGSRQIQLPSFQRDAVWDEAHIELLWDSLWHGYPIGSLLFADISRLSDAEHLTVRQTQVSHVEAAQRVRENLDKTDYIIIDGQQRAIAIALGLRRFQPEDSARLWVDLGAGAKQLFTVCTIQKPWGRDATRAQIAGAKQTLDQRLLNQRGELQRDIPPLLYTWPTRRILPVPLADLLQWLGNGRRGDWRELVPETKWDRKAREDIEVVFQILQGLREKQLPVYLVRDLSHDQLGEVFQRLNKQGVVMSDQDLFFSALKMKWPQAHNLVWEIYGDEQAGKVMNPGEIVHLAVRLVVGSQRNVSRLNMAEFERLAEKEPQQFADLQHWLNPQPGSEVGRLHDCLRRARKVLLYDPGRGRNDAGLPPVLLARLPWRVWHTLVAWLAQHDEVSEHNREGMIRYALLDYYFSGNATQRLERVPFELALDSISSFPGFEIYTQLWRAGQLERNILTLKEFSDSLREAESGPPPAPLFKQEPQLGLWTQRAYLYNWFPNFDPTRYGSSSDFPYDLDHILPSAFRNMKGRTRNRRPAPEFWRWRWRVLSGPGNVRWWPASLNRSDRHKNLDKKFLLGAPEQETPSNSLLRAYGLNTVAEVRKASHLDEDQLQNWERGANGSRPYDWQDPERIRALRVATDARRLALYQQIYEGINFAAWRERFDLWLAETIRKEVAETWVGEITADQTDRVILSAKSVAEELGLHGHVEAIYEALNPTEFHDQTGLRIKREPSTDPEEDVQWIIEW